MELGGNIELYGLDEYRENDLIVIKKIVGHFAKHFTEKFPSFEGLVIAFDYEDGMRKVTASVQLGEELYESTQEHKNTYFALDAALKDVMNKTEA